MHDENKRAMTIPTQGLCSDLRRLTPLSRSAHGLQKDQLKAQMK